LAWQIVEMLSSIISSVRLFMVSWYNVEDC